MFNQLQLIFGGMIIVALGGLYYFFHVQPMNELEDEINTLKSGIVSRGIMIKELGDAMAFTYAVLYTCEDNLTVQYNQGYIDALGGTNDTIIDVDIDNLHT